MGQEQEIKFARTLEEVKSLAKKQQNSISEDQVKEAFKELSLSEQQLELVYDYLKKHRIGIGEPLDPQEYLSDGEINYLEEYKKGLEGKAGLSDGQRQALFHGAMAGEKKAQQELIHACLSQVAEISRLYAGQGVSLDDLIGEGNLALSAGVTMLGCLENAREAEGMLMKIIMDAMEECIAENSRVRDQDKRVEEQVNQVARGAEKLAKELRRKVTAQELAQETGMTLETIEDAMRMSGFAIEDLER